MKKKPTSNSFLYFFGSIILIVTAVVVTTILGRTSNTATTQDVRARASVTSLMRLTAVVTSINEAQGLVAINDLKFTGSTPESLESLARNTAGEWQVAADTINLSTLLPGSRVELQVNPSSFNIAKRTLTASAITITK